MILISRACGGVGAWSYNVDYGTGREDDHCSSCDGDGRYGIGRWLLDRWTGASPRLTLAAATVGAFAFVWGALWMVIR